MDTLILLLRLLLAAVFAVAGAAKLQDLKGSRKAMEDFGLPARFVAAGGVLLPLAELAVAATLLFPPTARWGAVAAVVLLAVFVAAIANAMAHDRAPDCHCFGQLHSEPAGRSTLVRNGVLIALAVAIAVLGPGPGIHSWIGDRAALELVLVAVVLIAMGLAAPRVVAWSRRRQERRRAEAAAALQAPGGRPVGSPAPDFTLRSVDGEQRTLEMLCADGRPVALVFVHPTCGPCHALLPTLADWRSRLGARVNIAVVSEGSPEDNRALQQQHGLDELLLQERSEVYQAYEFKLGTPAAVVIDPDGRIASAAVSGSLAVEEVIRFALQRADALAPA